jgi:autotransporter-associated beta strand protein
MRNLSRSFLIAAAATASAFAQQYTGPSSSQSPYATVTAPGWTATSILTTGDSALNGYRMGGVPDGLGVFDNGNGTFTLLSNHELFDTWGVTRPDGAKGAYVSMYVINKSNFQVVSGQDFIAGASNLYLYNANAGVWANTGAYNSSGAFTSGASYAMWRLCSADLGPNNIFLNATTGNGYAGRIFMNGEEGAASSSAGNPLGSRGFAWVATGASAGNVYELPHLGRFSIENLLVNPFLTATDTTLVAGNSDYSSSGIGGQVYMYLGTKTATGTAIDKAGLTNGQLYGIKVTNGGANYANGAVTNEGMLGINGTFVLANTGNSTALTAAVGAGVQGLTGSAAANAVTASGLRTAATGQGITTFSRPEDGAWLNANTYLFNCTGLTPLGSTTQASSKVYKLDFSPNVNLAGVGNYTLGGNINVILDTANLRGKDGATAWMLDNMAVGADGLVYLNEDPGNNIYVSKTWVINPLAGTQAQVEASATQIIEVDRSRFLGTARSAVSGGITGANTLTVASTAGFAVGMKVGLSVGASGIPDGTTITAINAATGVLTLSNNLTAAVASGTLLAGVDFRSTDEEFTGIIDITSMMADGTKWLLVAVQNHAAVAPNSSDPYGLVEGGQYIALHYTSNSVALPGSASATLTLSGDTLAASGTSTIANPIVLAGTGGILDVAGTTTISTGMSGAGQLWKLGAGELILSAANSYTGNTNVSGGILTIDGSVASAAVNVYKGATLKGHGTINGNVFNYGTVAPGNSPGVLTVNGNYTENGVLDVEIGGIGGAGVNPNGHDQLVVNGTFTAVPATASPTVPGATLKVSKYNGFDPVRTQSFQVIRASAFAGNFTTLDRGTQTAQLFFQPSTGYVYGTGLAEGLTFAAYDSIVANRQAIGAALYADGLVSGTIIANGAGSTTSTGKAYLASNDVGNAVAGVLLAADVGVALDALSPETYGAVAQMGARNAHSLARSLLSAMPTGDAWTYQLGYDESRAASTASPTSLNGEFNVNSTYALATRGFGGKSKLTVMVSTDHGNVTASGFASKMTGQTVGLGFGTDFGGARLDLGFTSGVESVSGTRSGQAFGNAKLAGSSVMARLTLAPVAGFKPFFGLSRSNGTMDAIAETGTGANLNVASFSQSLSLAEVGAEYSYKLSDKVALGLTAAYEHDLGSNSNSISATFADASAPTAFTVNTYGFGKDQFRGGLSFKAALSDSSSAGLSYEVRSGNGVKSASELKLNYACRF